MDWDWEDGPPRDTRRRRTRRARLERAAADGRTRTSPGPEPTGTASGRQEPPPLDAAPEYVLPDRTGRPAASRPARRRVRATPKRDDRIRRASGGRRRRAVARADEYRPRSPEDRTARREQRRRQLRRRRLVALAVLIAIVVLIVVLIVRGCGGSDAGAAAAAFVSALRGQTPAGGPGATVKPAAMLAALALVAAVAVARASPAAAAAGSGGAGAPLRGAPGARPRRPRLGRRRARRPARHRRRRRDLEAPALSAAAARRGRRLHRRADRLARHRRRHGARDHRRRRRLDRGREGEGRREGDRRDRRRHAWIVGNALGAAGDPGAAAVFRTTDAGATWKRTGFGMAQLADVAFADERHGVLVALDRIWSTRDGGRTWRLRRELPMTVLTSVAAGDSRHAWVAGWDTQDGDPLVCATSDGGATWSRLRVDVPPAAARRPADQADRLRRRVPSLDHLRRRRARHRRRRQDVAAAAGPRRTAAGRGRGRRGARAGHDRDPAHPGDAGRRRDVAGDRPRTAS